MVKGPAIITRPEGFSEIVEGPYGELVEAFDHFDISRDRMPSMDDIGVAELDSVLRYARKHMQQPELNLEPPLTRHEMVGAIDAHRKNKTITQSFDTIELWGSPSPSREWQASIVEGKLNPDLPVHIARLQEAYREQPRTILLVELIRHSLREQALVPLKGANAYLALHARALDQRRVFNTRTKTVLNEPSIYYSHMAMGSSEGSRVALEVLHGGEDNTANIHMRASIPLRIRQGIKGML